MRLIDADDLKKRADEVFANDEIEFKDLIDNAPTVEEAFVIEFKEPLPLVKAQKIVKFLSKRPQGEWIDYDNTFYKCPECGYLLEKDCPQCQNKVILPKGGAE